MRRIGLLTMAALCLCASGAQAQQAYAAVLLEYLTGDPDAAVGKVRKLERDEILAGLDAFNTTHSTAILRGAAALHTEAALRVREETVDGLFQVQVATAIVEFGEPANLKSNTPLSIQPAHAAPVTPEFRSLFYCAIVNVLLAGGRLQMADGYLDHGVFLSPANSELRLLAGVAQEMRRSERIAGLSGSARRDALRAAERHYRAVLAAQPDRLEARLRLGRVVQQRNELAEARTLLQPLAAAADDRIAYLGQLFLGGVEDALQHPELALAAYDAASARMPLAQTARLAASELRHRGGDRTAAADAVPAAAGAANTYDPWWTYIFGEYWRHDLLLDALRKLRRP